MRKDGKIEKTVKSNPSMKWESELECKRKEHEIFQNGNYYNLVT